jgi:hypothetical protein
MAKYHVALVKVPISSVGSAAVYDMIPVSSEIIDTTVSKLSTIYPHDKNLYWVVTPLDTDGWLIHGAAGDKNTAPAPAPALSTGWPLFSKVEKAVAAPLYRRIGIQPTA